MKISRYSLENTLDTKKDLWLISNNVFTDYFNLGYHPNKIPIIYEILKTEAHVEQHKALTANDVPEVED